MATRKGEAQWVRVRGWMQQGRCRLCGRPRGKAGTKQHCRRCADVHNAFMRARYLSMRAAWAGKEEGDHESGST